MHYFNFFLSLVILIISPGAASAGHIVGGEFTYSCRGFLNDDPSTNIKVYEVRINMYRDCVGLAAWFDGAPNGFGPPPDSLMSVDGHITVFRGDAIFIPTLMITLGDVSEVPVDLGNPCLTLTEEICQQIGIYDFTLELEVSEEPYTLSYQRCCRNGEIINLEEPARIGTTYFIEITPEAQQRCNESPAFNIDPPIAICLNLPFQIDMGATDREGDSLVYKLCESIIDHGGNRDYSGNGLYPTVESAPPYEAAVFRTPQFDVENQLGIGSTFRIDSNTGLLEGEPIFRGIFALAVCIEEWSRGSTPVLLSATKREFQLGVNRCDLQLNADLLEEEIDAQGRFILRQCGLGEATIVNESTNIEFIESYRWLVEGPGGVFTSTDRNLNVNIQTPGVYEGLMILNENSSASNCIDTAVFVLDLSPGVSVDFEFMEPGCNDEPIEFMDRSTSAGDNTIVEWKWTFGESDSLATRQNPFYQYRTPGIFPVGLTIFDDNQCTADTVILVTYFPSPRTLLVEPEEGFGCAPFTKEFDNLSRPINDQYIFEWDFGDGGTSAQESPVHRYENVGLYDVYLGVTSPTGCFVDTIFQNLVDVRTVPVADFEWLPQEPTNLMPDFQIIDQSVDVNHYRYFLRTREGRQLFTTQLADFEATLRDSSSVFITQIVTHPGGCTDTITKVLRQKLVNTYFMPNAFTPNGDGLNSFLVPKGIFTGITDYRMRVWTRYGELIFTTDEPRLGWDGTFNGSSSPGGGYLWDAQFIDVGGEFQEFKGGVVLIR